MPFGIAKLGPRRTSNSLKASPSASSDLADQLGSASIDYAEPVSSYFQDALPEDSPVIGRRSSSVSPVGSPARFPSSASLPVAGRVPSSPLVQSVSAADVSPKTKLKLPGLLKRAKSKTPDVEPLPTYSPPLSSSVGPPATQRPALGLRTRTGSLTRWGRSRSGSASTAKATSPISPEEGEGTFTLVSFRSARPESPTAVSPPQQASPSIDAGRPRTPPLVPPTRRPSSQIFNDPLTSPPSSPSIKASYFQEAKAARSQASLHRIESSNSLQSATETLSRPTSRLDLPSLPPPTARAREPLIFVPPAASRYSSYEVARPRSPSPSLGKLESSPVIKESKPSFAPPKPAFLQGTERRHSIAVETLLQPSRSASSPISPTLRSALPAVSRTVSEMQYTAKVAAVRDKARSIANGVYAYASERTEEAARRSTSDEDTSFDAAVGTDSEDGISDDNDTSETSHSKSEERPAWNSKEAQNKRAEASRQALEASQRGNSSFSTLSEISKAQPVPACMPALAIPLYTQQWSNEPVEDVAPAPIGKAEEQPRASGPDTSPKLLDRPRPVTRSREKRDVSKERSDSPMPREPSRSPQRPSKSAARPPFVPRHRGRYSTSSFDSLPPVLTNSTSSTASGASVLQSSGHYAQSGPSSAPPGIDPQLWDSLSFDARHAIEEQTRAFIASLVQEAVRKSPPAQPRTRSATTG